MASDRAAALEYWLRNERMPSQPLSNIIIEIRWETWILYLGRKALTIKPFNMLGSIMF